MKKIYIAILLLSIVSCSELARKYSISGNIYDSNNNPLQGAYCEFGSGNDSSTYSDENGYFSLSWEEDIAGGCPILTVELTGYKIYTFDWDCESDRSIDNHVVNLELAN